MTAISREEIINPTWIYRFILALMVGVGVSLLSVAYIEPNQFQLVESLNFLMLSVYGFTACCYAFLAWGSTRMEGVTTASAMLFILAIIDFSHAGQIYTFWHIRMIQDAHTFNEYNATIVNVSNFVYRFPIVLGHLLIFAFLGIASRRIWLPIVTFLYALFWVLGLAISEYV